MPLIVGPGIRKPVARRQWVRRVEHILVEGGNPTTTGDGADDGRPATDHRRIDNLARELGADDRAM